MNGKRITYSSTLGELHQKLIVCYKKCIKQKTHVKNTVFHLYFETWISRLAKEIITRKYVPRPSTVFIVTKPRPREIVAAHLLDRVVHHFICNHLEPWWERRFDRRSYACRPGKGTLAASRDLRDFVRGYQAHNSHPLWYLKVDVKAFFPSMDRSVLDQLIVPKISNTLIRDLTSITIHHNPVAPGNYRLASPPHLMSLVPPHKSLFRVTQGKGLPIGNLSSQFFANVYMNELDQFMARRMDQKPLYWQRYVDDIVCLDTCPNRLSRIVIEIENFLSRKLQLSLHPQKTIIQPLSRGLDHLGYFHLPNRTYPRKRVIKAATQVINSALLGPESDSLIPSINSYLGHFRHANAFTLRQEICKTITQSDPTQNLFIKKDFRSIKDLSLKSKRKKILNSSISEIMWDHFN